ncbi:MAG: cupin domain-containing protein [Kiritimatiellia bacterium]|nr:cupin domain-containing protein [Kiritimatiellia bacterium]
MNIADLKEIVGRTFPAGRRTRNLAGGTSPIQPRAFALGHVTLDPNGGQVPWHCQDQEEVYFLLEGRAEMCLGEERRILDGGQAVFIPPGVYHQITNLSDQPAKMIYAYGPAGDVAHWKQELAGTLPRAGVETPPLPAGAFPQCTRKPDEDPQGKES